MQARASHISVRHCFKQSVAMTRLIQMTIYKMYNCKLRLGKRITETLLAFESCIRGRF